MAQTVGSACNVEDTGLIPGLGRSLEKKWQPTLVFLPGEFPWAEEPGKYSPWGHKESDMKEQLSFHFHVHETTVGMIMILSHICTRLFSSPHTGVCLM